MYSLSGACDRKASLSLPAKSTENIVQDEPHGQIQRDPPRSTPIEQPGLDLWCLFLRRTDILVDRKIEHRLHIVKGIALDGDIQIHAHGFPAFGITVGETQQRRVCISHIGDVSQLG